MPTDQSTIQQIIDISGQLHSELVREIPRILKLSQDELAKETVTNFANLQKQGLLTADEFSHLQKVAESATPQTMLENIKGLQSYLKSEGEKISPLAMQMGAIVSSSLEGQDRRSWFSKIFGDIAGGALGALAGYKLGGVGGAVAGGIAGAAAGSRD